MWISSLYLMEDFVWHNLCCLKGECQNCGVDIFMTCHAKMNKHFILCMQWKCYELVIHGKTWARNPNKVLQLQYKQTTTKELLDYLRPKLIFFVIHIYVSKFQEEQYDVCLDTFPPTSILLVVDFVDNYSFHNYNEV